MRRSSPNIPGILLAAGLVWSAIFWWAPLAGSPRSRSVRMPAIDSPDPSSSLDRKSSEREVPGAGWEQGWTSPANPDANPGGVAGGARGGPEDQQSPDSEPRYYIIRSGDRLETIARDVLGSRAAVQRLLDANPGIDPLRLRPGQRIRIPDE